MQPANPRRTAVALAYSGGRGAPRVVAKGRALLADSIVAAARGAGVPLHESPELAQVLAQVDIGREIPPSLYIAVAELLAWVRRMEAATATAGVPAAPAASAPLLTRAP